jgi:hypothetical protein
MCSRFGYMSWDDEGAAGDTINWKPLRRRSIAVLPHFGEAELKFAVRVADNADEAGGDVLFRPSLPEELYHAIEQTCAGGGARLAGRVLELLCPALWRVPSGGLHLTGSLEQLDQGSLPIILANEKRVAVISIPGQANRFAHLRDLVNAAKRAPLAPEAWRPENALMEAHDYLEEYGTKPDGEGGLDAGEATMIGIVAILFSLLPPEQWRTLDNITRSRLSPALVGLFGLGASGTHGTMSAAWPSVLPLVSTRGLRT